MNDEIGSDRRKLGTKRPGGMAPSRPGFLPADDFYPAYEASPRGTSLGGRGTGQREITRLIHRKRGVRRARRKTRYFFF